jgi:hypothetical protein
VLFQVLLGADDLRLASGRSIHMRYTVSDGTHLGDVMRQLTVEMDEKEMILLEAAARARGIDPRIISKTQLLELLEAVTAAGPNMDASLTREPEQVALSARRARRLEALMKMHGIWKGDPDKPQDGTAYQQEVRAEWR